MSYTRLKPITKWLNDHNISHLLSSSPNGHDETFDWKGITWCVGSFKMYGKNLLLSMNNCEFNLIFSKPRMVCEYLENMERIDYEMKLAYSILSKKFQSDENFLWEYHGNIIWKDWDIAIEPFRVVVYNNYDAPGKHVCKKWTWGWSRGIKVQTMIKRVIKTIEENQKLLENGLLRASEPG